ncbi:MAG: hypothetical protein R6V45_02875 [Oceanipulchritudo sp.]
MPTQPKNRTVLFLCLGAAALLAAAGLALYLFRDALFPLPPLSELRTTAYEVLNAVPAPLYFLALVVLPATGFPMTVFYLSALPVLGTHGKVTGVLLVWAALGLNMILTRYVARGVFHPAIEWALRHRNLKVPKLRRETEWKVVLATRISPLPFALQNYLLALGHARWRTYLGLSLPIQGAIGLAVMLLGESILTGGLAYVLLALFLLLVLNLLLHSLRKRLTRETPQSLN